MWRVLIIVLLFTVASCSTEKNSAPSQNATPTINSIFLGRNNAPPVTAQTTPKSKPTISDIFSSQIITPTSGATLVAGTPTIAPVFRGGAVMSTTQSSDRSSIPTLVPIMSSITQTQGITSAVATTSRANSAAVSKPAPRLDLTEKVVFDDELNANWSLENSRSLKYNAKDSAQSKSGTVSISVTPQQDIGTLYFSVRKDAKENYLRSRVWGVSVWVNSGRGTIGVDDMAMTVVGSNQYPYWVSDDKSVLLDKVHFFSESKLYYLGVMREIPPNTWVELVVQIDKLPYDPDYKYVTGVYLKNGTGILNTVYIDRLTLLLIK